MKRGVNLSGKGHGFPPERVRERRRSRATTRRTPDVLRRPGSDFASCGAAAYRRGVSPRSGCTRQLRTVDKVHGSPPLYGGRRRRDASKVSRSCPAVASRMGGPTAGGHQPCDWSDTPALKSPPGSPPNALSRGRPRGTNTPRPKSRRCRGASSNFTQSVRAGSTQFHPAKQIVFALSGRTGDQRSAQPATRTSHAEEISAG